MADLEPLGIRASRDVRRRPDRHRGCAGESVYVISDGQRLARTLRLDKVIRWHAVPLSLSFPWGARRPGRLGAVDELVEGRRYLIG